MTTEAAVTINGKEMNPGQAMTIWVALNCMLMDMSMPNALGADDMGTAIASGYLAHCQSILAIITSPVGGEPAIPKEKP